MKLTAPSPTSPITPAFAPEVRAIADEIPIEVTRVTAAGAKRTLSAKAIASDPIATVAVTNLRSALAAVAERVPEALQRAKDGVEIRLDASEPDYADAGGLFGSVELGFGPPRQVFRLHPARAMDITGHELGHELIRNINSDETAADLLGIAIARRTGHAASDDWTLSDEVTHGTAYGKLAVRDLEHPVLPDVAALRAKADGDLSDDFDLLHHAGGPVGAAVARTAKAVGTDVVDGITFEALLRELPKLPEQDLRPGTPEWDAWTSLPVSERYKTSLDKLATAYVRAATTLHGADSPAAQELARQFASVGLDPGASST